MKNIAFETCGELPMWISNVNKKKFLYFEQQNMDEYETILLKENLL